MENHYFHYDELEKERKTQNQHQHHNEHRAFVLASNFCIQCVFWLPANAATSLEIHHSNVSLLQILHLESVHAIAAYVRIPYVSGIFMHCTYTHIISHIFFSSWIVNFVYVEVSGHMKTKYRRVLRFSLIFYSSSVFLNIAQ